MFGGDNISSKVSAFTSMNLSEFIDLSEIIVLYMVFFNPSLGKKVLFLSFLSRRHN